MTLPDRVVAALADRYTIVRELGAGGMATVYLAEDLRHRRKVAIKVLREDLSASVGATRFLREIEIAAQLQHPNILPLLDSGSADGRLFYVMPFMEGQSLRQRLNRERELPVHEAVRLLTEIVDALAHAHQHGVVHRDIKPDNVMLSGRHAVVADFGIARAVSESAGASTVTSMGIAIGTPAYMAPEQATADPAIDKRADIYAVGVVAYELLTGRPLFLGMTPQQVLAAHVTQRPDPLSQHRPGVSPALEMTVMRCLEKRPADRWQSADELLSALEPLATPSGGSVPTSARLRAATAASPRRWIMAAIGVFVLVAAAIGATMLLQRPAAVEALGTSAALTTEAGLEVFPEISPDGKFVAYAAGNSASLRVFVRPVGGGRALPLSEDTSAFQYQPRWSAPGQWTSPRRLGFGFFLQFLNDSTLIWGSLEPRPGRSPAVIRSMPADSGESRIVLEFSPADGLPSGYELSRDGRRLYVKKHDPQGRASTWSHPLDGGPPKLLMRFPDLNRASFRPVFTTDEKRIYFTIDDRQSDVFVAELVKR